MVRSWYRLPQANSKSNQTCSVSGKKCPQLEESSCHFVEKSLPIAPTLVQ